MVWLWWLGCPFVTDARLDEMRDADADGVLNERFGGDDCDDLDPRVGSPRRWFSDADADGYGDPERAVTACEPPEGAVADDSDCDDTDPVLAPDLAFFADADADGYGDPTDAVRGCVPPTGYVRDDSDCDDADPSEHPGAHWHADLDADGYGDPEVWQEGCASPGSGWVAAAVEPFGFDCDDAAPDVNPGVPPEAERPADGVDQNCDEKTELDFDGDGLPDIPGCEGEPLQRVSVAPGPETLTQAIASLGSGCAILELGDGAYGAASLDGPRGLALAAAPGTAPVLVPTASGSDRLDVPRGSTLRGLLLEGLAFEGLAAILRTSEPIDVLTSGLSSGGGAGFAVASDVEAGDLTVYDASFEGGDVLVGPGWEDVRFARVRVDGGVTALDDYLLLGGRQETELVDVEFVNSAALRALVRVVGERLHIERATFSNTLMTTIDSRVAEASLADVRIENAATTVFPLLSVVPPEGGVGTSTATVSGLSAVDNVWSVADAGIICQALVLLDEHLPVSAGDIPTFRLETDTVQLTDSALRNNRRDCEGTLLAAGPGATVSGLELASDGPVAGSRGIVLSGAISSSTIVGFETGAVIHRDLPGQSQIDRVVIAGTGAQPDLAFDFELPAQPDVSRSTFWLAGVPPMVPPLGPGNTTDTDPRFLRYHPRLSPALWDLELRSDSPLPDRGVPAAPESTADTDADDLPDGWEIRWCADTPVACAPSVDLDGDGLDNRSELDLGTLPLSDDTDADGLPDGLDPAPLDPTA